MKRFSTALVILMGAGLMSQPAGGQSSGAESSEELGRAAQRELARLGCFTGDAAGSWGRESRAAIKRFNQISQTTWPDWPAADMIGSLRTYADGFCSVAASVAPEKKQPASSAAKLPAETRLEERSARPLPAPPPLMAVEKPAPPAPPPPAVTAVEKKPEPNAASTGQWQPANEAASTAPAADGQMFSARVEKPAPKADTAKPLAGPVKPERPSYLPPPKLPAAPVPVAVAAPVAAPAPVVASTPAVPALDQVQPDPSPPKPARATWMSGPNLDGR